MSAVRDPPHDGRIVFSLSVIVTLYPPLPVVPLISKAQSLIDSSPMMSPHPSALPIGLIGLGLMGGAFAARLLSGGFSVVGCDLDPARREALAQ